MKKIVLGGLFLISFTLLPSERELDLYSPFQTTSDSSLANSSVHGATHQGLPDRVASSEIEAGLNTAKDVSETVTRERSSRDTDNSCCEQCKECCWDHGGKEVTFGCLIGCIKVATSCSWIKRNTCERLGCCVN